jgi:hypothetical protein
LTQTERDTQKTARVNAHTETRPPDTCARRATTVDIERLLGMHSEREKERETEREREEIRKSSANATALTESF